MRAVLVQRVRRAAGGHRGARPGAAAGWRGAGGRGDRAVPQRLARLARPRPGHHAAARARPRAGRHDRRGRAGGARLGGRRPGDGPVRLRLRDLRSSAGPASSRSAPTRSSPASATGARSPSTSAVPFAAGEPGPAAGRDRVRRRGGAGVRFATAYRGVAQVGAGRRGSGWWCSGAAASGCPR